MRRGTAGKILMVILTMATLSFWGEASWGMSQEVGLRFGYGKSTRKASVKLYDFFPRWGVFLIKPGQSLPGGLGLSVVLEGVVGVARAEEDGWELGLTPLLKLTLPLVPKANIFVEGGAGIIWENINSPTIAHTFNFTPQVGGGLELALSPRLGFSLAYRYRHSSNAGLYKENSSFNVNFFQAGLSYYY